LRFQLMKVTSSGDNPMRIGHPNGSSSSLLLLLFSNLKVSSHYNSRANRTILWGIYIRTAIVLLP
jgi:hypothetical protein